MNNQDLFENLSREGIQTTEEQRKNINRRINEVLNLNLKLVYLVKPVLVSRACATLCSVGMYVRLAM